MVLLLMSCSSAENEGDHFVNVTGETMGTYYNLTGETEIDPVWIAGKADSLLIALNAELSTYIEDATISIFNRSDTGIILNEGRSKFFLDNLAVSEEIHEQTHGNFDPTVMPLVNYWGFGYAGRKPPAEVDSMIVDSLLQYVGWDKILLEDLESGHFLRKESGGVQLDFSAVAKGYGIDLLVELFEGLSIDNYLIDIGGEVCINGDGRGGKGWVIGVNTPDPRSDEREVARRFQFRHGCVATSGNYRNFREVNGVSIGHTINPLTGFPEMNNLLSVTIWNPTAARADAIATAALVAGYPKGKEMIQQLDNTEAFFMYINPDNELKEDWTMGFEKFFLDK